MNVDRTPNVSTPMILHIRPTEFTTEEARSFGFRASVAGRQAYADGFTSLDDVRVALAPETIILTVAALCPALQLHEVQDSITAVRLGDRLYDATEIQWPRWGWPTRAESVARAETGRV
jgi:hypothetical protein